MTIPKVEPLCAVMPRKDFSLGIGALLVISAAISCFVYHLFYHFAPVFWEMNSKFPVNELTPWISSQMWNRDGIEVYVLYVLMFTVVAVVYGLWQLYCRLGSKKIRLALLAALLPAALYYIKLIGFHPPLGNAPGAYASLGFLLLIFSGIALLAWLEALNKKLADVAVALVLIPIFFIATRTAYRSVYWFDTSYVLTPALQILHGAKFSEVFLLYDVLLTLLASILLKLGFEPALFQRLGQAALYLLIFGIYLFSRRFFVGKYLSAPLFAGLVLLKEYAGWWDPTCIPQGSPLRHDWWFVLLLLVYARGAAHWSVGLAAGLLVLLHRAWGLIYTAAYFQLILLLFALDFAAALAAGKTGVSPGETAKKHFFRNLPNISLIAICFVLNLVFLGWDNEKCGVIIFQQLGIGFLKIAGQSFYWHVPILFGALFALLLSRRSILPERYLTTGLFLVLLSIGNSLYFFGRSHEANIIGISSSLVLCLFLFLDLAGTAAHEEERQRPLWRRLGVMALPYAFVLIVAASYSVNITARARVQYENLKKGQWLYTPTKPDLAEMKKITHNSPLVYFMVAPVLHDMGEGFMEGDILYYYYGGYTPVGFWSPYQNWLITKDLAVFLQDLLDKGYYLVANADYYSSIGMPPGVTFGEYVITSDGYMIMWQPKTAQKKRALRSATYISPLRAVQNLVAQNPTPENYLNLGLNYYSRGFFQESASAAKRAYMLRPRYAEAYNVAGAAYNSMKMWDEAIAVLEKAVLLKPDFQLAGNNLLLAKNEKASGAPVVPYISPVKAAKNIAETYPAPENYLNLALAYYTANLFEECVSASQQALKLRPEYAEAYNIIGAAYNNMRMWDEAIAALEKATRLSPGFQLAVNNLNLARIKKGAGWGR